ncbi:MAG: DUF4147 domain-containing protein [Acidobacteriaceae bacterium]
MSSLKHIAREIFLQTLSECTVESAFARNVDIRSGELRVCDAHYDLRRYSKVLTIAAGKAAHVMAESLYAIIGDRAGGIIAASHAPERELPGFRYSVGGHPLPNAESLRAGAEIIDALRLLDEQSLVIYLISGGASALMEVPFDAELTLEDVIATYLALLHSGASIAEMNALRKHLSAVKGGRMAQAAVPAQQVSLLISDVPASALDALASGPTMPDPTTREDCYAVAERYGLVARFPPRVRKLFVQRALTETPKSGEPAFARSQWHTLLSSEAVQQSAAAHASAAGFKVEIDNTCDDWDYARAADYLLHRLSCLRAQHPRVCIVNTGEVTVSIPAEPGLGGRNQQFALYCARKIAGKPIAVLSAGTDGIDGNSDAAGAIVDGNTVIASGAGKIRQALAEFNAGPLLNALGDAIVIGHTGNNLRDLRMLLAE